MAARAFAVCTFSALLQKASGLALCCSRASLVCLLPRYTLSGDAAICQGIPTPYSVLQGEVPRSPHFVI